MAQPGFWDDQTAAQKTIGEVNRLKSSIEGVVELKQELEDAQTMLELLDESGASEGSDDMREVAASIEELYEKMDELEVHSFLSGPHDHLNAIITIHSGAGGTESCDWADMLFRLYTRWAEKRGLKVEVQDLQPGDEAGLSRVTFRVIGENAYGFAKAERGVHRLVRISPFDSNKRRHTSFCSVDVIAEIDDGDFEVEIDEKDLRIDTYRSSGKGGQHVNTTDSAVRITHLPTNIVAACQNERSQMKNKAAAMKVLKSRLYERMLDEKRSEMEKFYGEKNEIGWGNQIRSYVFQPYQMVKDLRTGVETGNLQEVMDGGIDPFIHAWLRAGCPSVRNKEAQVDV